MLNRESPSRVPGSASRYWVESRVHVLVFAPRACAVSTAASSSGRPAGLRCSMALGSVRARSSQPEVCAAIQPNHLLLRLLGASGASLGAPPAVCDVRPRSPGLCSCGCITGNNTHCAYCVPYRFALHHDVAGDSGHAGPRRGRSWALAVAWVWVWVCVGPLLAVAA